MAYISLSQDDNFKTYLDKLSTIKNIKGIQCHVSKEGSIGLEAIMIVGDNEQKETLTIKRRYQENADAILQELMKTFQDVKYTAPLMIIPESNRESIYVQMNEQWIKLGERGPGSVIQPVKKPVPAAKDYANAFNALESLANEVSNVRDYMFSKNSVDQYD